MASRVKTDTRCIKIKNIVEQKKSVEKKNSENGNGNGNGNGNSEKAHGKSGTAPASSGKESTDKPKGADVPKTTDKKSKKKKSKPKRSVKTTSCSIMKCNAGTTCVEGMGCVAV